MNVPIRNALTNTEEIFIDWLPITSPEDGNSEVLSYSLEYDKGTSGESW